MDKIVRRQLADGTVKEYRYKKVGQAVPRSIGALIEEYKASQGPRGFSRLSKNSKIGYLRAMDHVAAYADTPIVDIKRRHILGQCDQLATTPAIANRVIRMWSILMNFAVDREYRTDNPAQRIPTYALGEHERWSQEALAYALAHLPEVYRRAVVLGLYTGQREGDCVAMRWSDWDGQGIAVVQQKTGVKLWLPCPQALTSELIRWKAEATAMTILTTAKGLPWASPVSFATMFSREVRRHVELTGCVFHGLRKEAASRLAEAGCTVHEIMAVTGHSSLQMIQHYSRQAGQRGMASAAILKLDVRNRK